MRFEKVLTISCLEAGGQLVLQPVTEICIHLAQLHLSTFNLLKDGDLYGQGVGSHLPDQESGLEARQARLCR